MAKDQCALLSNLSSLKNYKLQCNLIMMSAVALSACFVITAIRSPESDGLIRYKTFSTLFSDEIFYSKYSAIQPMIAKLIDIVIRSLYGGLSANFTPVNIELILIGVFVFLGFFLLKKLRYDLMLFLILIPLSMLSHYAGQFFSEWTSSLLMAIGYLIFLSGCDPNVDQKQPQLKSVIFGAIIFALGVANWFVLLVPSLAVLFLAVFRYKFKKETDVRFVHFVCSSVLFALVFVVVDLAFKNQLFSNSYLSEGEKGFKTFMPFSGISGFSHPLMIGILANIFSFGKSIFLFNPFLIFLIICNYKYKIYTIVAMCVTVVVYSKWWAWYGGFSFGTRFYTHLIIPSIFVYIGYLRNGVAFNRIYGGLAMTAAIWVALCGKYFGLAGVASECAKDNYYLEALCWYVPEFSALIYPFVLYGPVKIYEYLTLWDMIYFLILFFVFFCVVLSRNFNKKYIGCRVV